MTMVVPAAPAGPRTSQGSGEAHVRRNAGDPDFAAALSETAGDISEEAAGDETTVKVRDVARPSPRAVHRLDARERRALAATDKADTGQSPEVAGNVVDGALVDVREEALPIGAEGPRLKDVPDAAALAAAPAGANAVPPPQLATPRTDAARDALAVLGVDLTAKNDTASAAEPMTPSRRSPVAGGPAPATKRSAASGEAGPFDGPDLPGDAPDIAATPIKVMRQETHFQPIAHEARRLLGMAAGAPDDRVLPLTLAAAAKINRPQALQRASQDVPTAPDRLAETPGASAPAASIAGDASTLGGIGQQIADGVQRAMAAPADPAAPRSAPNIDPEAPPAFAPAVRSIKLQLNPVSLGVVTIVLTGSDGELRIHLEAERAETFGKVEQERGALSARLHGAGYAVSELTVGRMGTADTQGRDGDQRDAAARQGGQAGSQTGSQQGDGAGGGSRGGAAQFADQRAGRHAEERADRENAAVTSAAKGGAVHQAVAGVSYAGRFRPV
jgi:hypothetical protein